MNVIEKKLVLVLNRQWQPIEIISHEDAFRLISKEHARALDTAEAYTTHSLQSWIDIHSHKDYKSIATPSLTIPIPEIIILTTYGKIPDRTISFNKRNLLIRDDFECAYCMCELTDETTTIDHIVPRAHGGKTSWSNCISSCTRCNSRKDDSLPEGEFKPQKSAKKPVVGNPVYSLNRIIKHGRIDIPPSWKQALFH